MAAPIGAILGLDIDPSPALRTSERTFQQMGSRLNSTIRGSVQAMGRLPLGRITGDFNQFNKSLDAAQSRVLSFSAAAGSIFIVQRAIRELTKVTIESEKALTDINVILNLNSEGLKKFGSRLFDIARNTGTTFTEVAKAAKELSRQGLGVEATLKRTEAATILFRISGLEMGKSVKAI